MQATLYLEASKAYALYVTCLYDSQFYIGNVTLSVLILFHLLCWISKFYKNSSGDEIANVNFLRRYGTYVLQNTKKENLLH